MDEDDCKVILSSMKVNIDPAQVEDLVSMIMEYDPEILGVLGNVKNQGRNISINTYNLLRAYMCIDECQSGLLPLGINAHQEYYHHPIMGENFARMFRKQVLILPNRLSSWLAFFINSCSHFESYRILPSYDLCRKLDH